MFSKLIAATILAVTFVSAQNVPLGECPLNCVTESLAAGGCTGITDLACVCSSAEFQSAATTCLTTNCTPEEQQAALQLQQEQCANQSGSVTPSASGAEPSATEPGASVSEEISSVQSSASSAASSIQSGASSRVSSLRSNTASPTGSGAANPSGSGNSATRVAWSVNGMGVGMTVMGLVAGAALAL